MLTTFKLNPLSVPSLLLGSSSSLTTKNDGGVLVRGATVTVNTGTQDCVTVSSTGSAILTPLSISGNLQVQSTAAATSGSGSGAMYIAGGVRADGPSYFYNTVTLHDTLTVDGSMTVNSISTSVGQQFYSSLWLYHPNDFTLVASNQTNVSGIVVRQAKVNVSSSKEATLLTTVTVTHTQSNSTTSFLVVVPRRSASFVNLWDGVFSVNSWVEGVTPPVPLENLTASLYVGSTNMLVTYTSPPLSQATIQVCCNYVSDV